MSCVRDESFTDYDALIELVSKSDFAKSLIRKFAYPGKDNSIPLFISWLYFANSFETIVLVLSSQINSDCSFSKKRIANYGIKKAINVSLKMRYRSENQWRNFLEVEEDSGSDNAAVRILRRKFSNTSCEEDSANNNNKGGTNVVNNFFSQQNTFILQTNINYQTFYVYEEPFSEETTSSDNKKESENINSLMLEYNIPMKDQKLESHIIGVNNKETLINRIEIYLKELTKNKGRGYAYLKIVLEENNLLDEKCVSQVSSFYNSLLLQYPEVKFICLRTTQDAYRYLTEVIKTKSGSILIKKNQKEERINIDFLANQLLNKE